MEFRTTKAGIAICPFFIWQSENIGEPIGADSAENDVSLIFCNHPKNIHDHEGNCYEDRCPLLQEG